MTATTYTLDESSIGTVLPVQNGFLTDLSMTTPPQHQTPAWSEALGRWVAGYMQLRGEHDVRDLYCADVRNNEARLAIGDGVGIAGERQAARPRRGASG
jgi:hypothetical protein